MVDGAIREAVLQKLPASALKKVAVKQGMSTLQEDGFAKAKEGITTIEEVLRMLHE